MRETLIRKRFGVPALLLIAIILTAGSAAAFLVASFRFTSNVDEPLEFAEKYGLNITYQGESDNITVHVQNLSMKAGYGIFVDTTIVRGEIRSVSYSTYNLVASEPAKNTDFNNDGDEVDAKYNIPAGFSYNIVVTIDTANNAEPENVDVTLELRREYMY